MLHATCSSPHRRTKGSRPSLERRDEQKKRHVWLWPVGISASCCVPALADHWDTSPPTRLIRPENPQSSSLGLPSRRIVTGQAQHSTVQLSRVQSPCSRKGHCIPGPCSSSLVVPGRRYSSKASSPAASGLFSLLPAHSTGTSTAASRLHALFFVPVPPPSYAASIAPLPFHQGNPRLRALTEVPFFILFISLGFCDPLAG